jgi:hypothetical protein
MYVLQNWTFTPGAEGLGEIEVPGVYAIEQFALITNITRNIPLFDPQEHEATITVADDGIATTVILHQNTSFCQPTDELQIVMYDLYSGGGGGPSSNVAVTNWPASQNINGAVSVTGEVEVKNDTGNPLPISGTVTANQGTSPWVVTGNSTVTGFPTTSTDSFGRLRVSDPFTIFDSSHRYSDNGQWATSTASGGTSVFNANQGLIDLNVTTSAGSRVTRQTTKVFPYQPGKSLLVMSTFVMAPGKPGLSQRVGYYGDENGYYVELTGSTLSFVERSVVSGSITETTVSQSSWNVDPMNGLGPSGVNLDITKAQILWLDMEWLGVGTVRMGFVVDGSFYVCHEWQHANLITSTYITTATLPITYEIVNDTTTSSSSTLKQICSTVISEGGYTLTGLQQSVGTPILTPKALATAGTYYPAVAIRLKSTRLDSVVILSALALMGNGNNETFAWRLVNNATVTGGTWNNVSADSSVEYNLSGTSVTGGNIVGSGYFNSSNQGSPTIELGREYLFGLQLSRNPFTGVSNSMVLQVASVNNNTTIYASMDWEEVSR